MKPIFIELTKTGQRGGLLYINMEKVSCMFIEYTGYTKLFFVGDKTDSVSVLETPKQIQSLVYTAYTPLYMDVGPG